MSKIALKSAEAGTGTFEIQAPATNTNRVLELPDEAGKIVTNSTPGTVLQVVQSATGTQITNSTDTFVGTGLSATITPTSSNSKILVIVNQNGVNKQIGATSADIRLRRGTTVLTNFAFAAAATNSTAENGVASASTTFLDSPQTTSPITYDTQFRSRASVAFAIVQHVNTTSSITLMEIAG